MEPSSGSNVIPTRARPGLAGLRPQNLFKATYEAGLSTFLRRARHFFYAAYSSMLSNTRHTFVPTGPNELLIKVMHRP